MAELERYSEANVEIDQTTDDTRGRSCDSDHSADVLAALAPGGAQRVGAAATAQIVPVVEPADQLASQLGSIDRGTALARSGATSQALPARAENLRGLRLAFKPMPIKTPQAGPDAAAGAGRCSRWVGRQRAFNQDPGDLSAAQADVVRPFDPGIASGP